MSPVDGVQVIRDALSNRKPIVSIFIISVSDPSFCNSQAGDATVEFAVLLRGKKE